MPWLAVLMLIGFGLIVGAGIVAVLGTSLYRKIDEENRRIKAANQRILREVGKAYVAGHTARHVERRP